MSGIVIRRLYLALTLLAVGYWTFGKAFAYIGVAPVYLGEVSLLLLALPALAATKRSCWGPTSLLAIYLCLLAVVALQVIYSAYDGNHLIESLRGSAQVYYGLFAFATCALLKQGKGRVLLAKAILTDLLPRLAPLILLGITVSMVAYVYFQPALPLIPGVDVPMLFYKPTDASVPLLLILSACALGYVARLYGLWATALLLLAAARNRSVLLALVVWAILVLRPRRTGGFILVSAVSMFALLLFTTDLSIDTGYRSLSRGQFAANLTSLWNPESAGATDRSTATTRSWRLAWWGAILEDSFHPDRILLGDGWGVNLAKAYGFQTGDPESRTALRNPHSAFINALARGGWMSAVLYAGFFMTALLRSLRQAWGSAETSARHLALLAVVLLAVAGVHGCTDVFLESPQNAIPLWIAVGASWAVDYRRGVGLRLPRGTRYYRRTGACLAEGGALQRVPHGGAARFQGAE